jgi:hypothetical protein
MTAIEYPLGSGEGEEIALGAGLKPMIRQLLAAGDLDRTRARFEALGFVTAIAPRMYGPTHEGWDDTPDVAAIDPKTSRRALFVARDRSAIEEGIEADLAKTDEGDRALGRLLGYPRCCVDAFLEGGKQRKNADVIASTVRATNATEAGFAPRLNVLDLAIFHWISWSPCTFGCAWSMRYADALVDVVGKRHPAFVRAIDAALSAHRLYVDDDVQLSIRGAFDGTTLTIDEVWPTARDRHPRATLADGARETTELLLRRVRAWRTMRLDDLESGALLAPFGEWKTTRAT